MERVEVDGAHEGKGLDVGALDLARVATYVAELEERESKYWQYLLEHKKLSAVYWAVCSMALLGELPRLKRDELIDYVRSCYRPDCGGYGGHSDQDAHLLYTLSALQVFAILDAMEHVDVDAVMAFVRARQNEDGSFAGDEWGEVDTRFSYAALLCARILKRTADLDVSSAIQYVRRCANFDGGFGCVPGAESHAGQVFCCVGALGLAGALPQAVDRKALGWWLCQRQLPCGGFNGRPDKLEDVCYSWWVLSALSLLGCTHWIDSQRLAHFIVRSIDSDTGGIADRPGDRADVFHTFFGLAGLSLLGASGLKAIDAAFALPDDVVKRLGLRLQETEFEK
mmetsp:Transcript_3347/g.9216  ORF Transcript_3347/g.9216 Transcript_3347/m.9216 type:complete len:339 (-) Transcript_3347:2519-3535(-)